MRYYGFSNYYLSQIQIGIQNLHCVVEIQQHYKLRSCTGILQYDEWAENHKTVVLLNGGNQESLIDLYNFLHDPNNPYPYSYFREDEQSLNLCLTCVGIILPEKIYEGAAFLRDRNVVSLALSDEEPDAGDWILINKKTDEEFGQSFSSWEVDLMDRLNGYRLA